MNRKHCSIVPTIACLAVPVFGQAVAPSCHVRLHSIAQPHPIDSTCGKQSIGPGRSCYLGQSLFFHPIKGKQNLTFHGQKIRIARTLLPLFIGEVLLSTEKLVSLSVLTTVATPL